MAEANKKQQAAAPAANVEVSQRRAERAARERRDLWHKREEQMLRFIDQDPQTQESWKSLVSDLNKNERRRLRREALSRCRARFEELGGRPRGMTDKQKRQEDRCACQKNREEVAQRRRRLARGKMSRVAGQLARKEHCCGDRWVERWQPGLFNVDEVPENPEPEPPRREPRIPRHCMTTEEWLDFMARPRDVRGCREDRTSAVGKHGKVKPLSLRLLELARPHPFRVQEAIKNAGQAMDDSRLRRLVEAAEQQSALTPEQIEEIVKVDEEHRREMDLARWSRGYRAKKRKRVLAVYRRHLAKAGQQTCRDSGDLTSELGEVLKRLKREAGPNEDDDDENDDDDVHLDMSYSDSDDDDYDEDDDNAAAPLSLIPVSS